MKEKNKKIAIGAISGLVALALPAVAFATNYVLNGLNAFSSFGFSLGLNSSSTLTQLIVNATEVLLGIFGALAVLFIVIGGFWYITSAGNEEQAEKGKKTLINAIIGIIIIMLCQTILIVIVNTVSGVN